MSADPMHLSENFIHLSGAPGSPYTRKMLALLRYRRLPYRYLVTQTQKAHLPTAKPALLPTFYFLGEDQTWQAHTDSTPLIRMLEQRHKGRSVVPPQPVFRLLDALLEDYFDEWLTKPMFHYRWSHPADVERSATVVPLPLNLQCTPEELAWISNTFSTRQIGRLGVVGSNPNTAALIEASYQRLLGLLDAHFQHHPFLLGKRPASCDFALYGQLSQLALFDPTPMDLACRLAPRVVAWAQWMEDLTGLEPHDSDWLADGPLPNTLLNLLRELGHTYQPVMLANAKAHKAGLGEVRTQVLGQTWVQATFPYQAKCVRWLQGDYLALTPADQLQWMAWMREVGCEALFHIEP